MIPAGFVDKVAVPGEDALLAADVEGEPLAVRSLLAALEAGCLRLRIGHNDRCSQVGPLGIGMSQDKFKRVRRVS